MTLLPAPILHEEYECLSCIILSGVSCGSGRATTPIILSAPQQWQEWWGLVTTKISVVLVLLWYYIPST